MERCCLELLIALLDPRELCSLAVPGQYRNSRDLGWIPGGEKFFSFSKNQSDKFFWEAKHEDTLDNENVDRNSPGCQSSLTMLLYSCKDFIIVLQYLEPYRGIAKHLKKPDVFLKEGVGEQSNLTVMIHSQHRPFKRVSLWNLFANLGFTSSSWVTTCHQEKRRKIILYKDINSCQTLVTGPKR